MVDGTTPNDISIKKCVVYNEKKVNIMIYNKYMHRHDDKEHSYRMNDSTLFVRSVYENEENDRSY
jgi:hypothetical protein